MTQELIIFICELTMSAIQIQTRPGRIPEPF